MIIINDQHLHRMMGEYLDHYHQHRTHQSLACDCPVSRPVERSARVRSSSFPRSADYITATHVGRLAAQRRAIAPLSSAGASRLAQNKRAAADEPSVTLQAGLPSLSAPRTRYGCPVRGFLRDQSCPFTNRSRRPAASLALKCAHSQVAEFSLP